MVVAGVSTWQNPLDTRPCDKLAANLLESVDIEILVLEACVQIMDRHLSLDGWSQGSWFLWVQLLLQNATLFGAKGHCSCTPWQVYRSLPINHFWPPPSPSFWNVTWSMNITCMIHFHFEITAQNVWKWKGRAQGDSGPSHRCGMGWRSPGWDRLPGLLEPAVGSLSFGEELELRSALAGATLRQGLSNKIAPSLLNPAPSSEIQVGAADMAPMLRRRWHPCWNGRRSKRSTGGTVANQIPAEPRAA